MSLYAASLQATEHDTAKFSVTLAVPRDKSVIFLCSTLSLNLRARHPHEWLKAIGLYPQAVCILLSLHLVIVVYNNICIKAGRQEVIPTFQIRQTFLRHCCRFPFYSVVSTRNRVTLMTSWDSVCSTSAGVGGALAHSKLAPFPGFYSAYRAV